MSALLKNAAKRLGQAGIANAALDSQLILAHTLGVSRETAMFGDAQLTQEQMQQFETLVARRAAREPMSHLLGRREFYGRDFIVTRDVLDPRADTETLIDAALEQARSMASDAAQPLALLDIGTGSGCIIITLLKEIAHSAGVGLDISDAALRVAFHNKLQHELDERLDLVHGSIADIHNNNSVLRGSRFDVIVSNPPYIPAGDIPHLMPEVRDFEPHLALDGGKDGLDCYRQLAKSLPPLLKPNGLVLMEIGAGQKHDVAVIFHAEGWQLSEVRSDLAGHERCMIFNR